MKPYFLAVLLLTGLNLNAQQIDFTPYHYSRTNPAQLNKGPGEGQRNLFVNEISGEGSGKSKKAVEHSFYTNNLLQSGLVFYNDSISAYLNKLKDFIITDEAQRNAITVYLIDLPGFNTFSNEFGDVFIPVGSIAALEHEEELIFLIAHEISHVVLNHSYKSKPFAIEPRLRMWRMDRYDISPERLNHKMLKEPETEADNYTLKLLKDRVNTSFGISLLEKMQRPGNPALKTKPEMSLMAGSDEEIRKFLDERWKNVNADTFSIPLKETVDQSKFLTLENRISSFRKQEENGATYSATGQFEKFKKEAVYLLVHNQLNSGKYAEALYTILQLRTASPEDKYLMTLQARSLTLYMQLRSNEQLADLVINNAGSGCDDNNFLRFRKVLVELDKSDILLMNYRIQKSLLVLGVESYVPAKKTFFQLLDKFRNDTIGGKTAAQALMNYDCAKSAVFKVSQHSVSEQIKAAEQGAIFGKQPEKVHFACSVGNGKTLDSAEQIWASEYQEIIKKKAPIADYGYANAFQGVNHMKHDVYRSVWWDLDFQFIHNRKFYLRNADYTKVFIHPYHGARRFKKGYYRKQPGFESYNNTVLITNDNMYLNCKKYKAFKINYVKSAEYDTKFRSLEEKYDKYNLDYSNNPDKKNSVYSNYMHKTLRLWVNERNYYNPLYYTPTEEEVAAFAKKTNTRYVLYKTSFITEDRATLKKFSTSYYEMYFDLLTREMVYLSRGGSIMRPRNIILENLIYQSEKHKN